MKILILGGTGLVGPHILKEIFLTFPDAEVHTITRSGKPYYSEKAHTMDRHDTITLQKTISAVAPDIFIDMVSFTREEAETTSHIINKINPDIPCVVASSIDIYAAYAKIFATESLDYQPCPISEDMTLRQKLGMEGAIYDKLNVEKTYLATIKNVTILRFPALYGWPDTSRVSHYLDQMLDGKTDIKISPTRAKWKFSRCLHKNAAFAVVKVLQAASKGQEIYNVAEEVPFTELEWCKKISALCGWQGKFIITETYEKDDLNQDFYVSTQKIRERLGFFEKYSPQEGLADTIAFHAYSRLNIPYKKCY